MYSSTVTNVASTLVELPSLIENLLLLLSEKEKVVILRRFNLDSKGKKTLEEIGQEFSITRERVRQIEKNALMKMRRNVFNTSLKSLNTMVHEIVKNHGGLIKKEKLEEQLAKVIAPALNVERNSLGLSLALHDSLESIGNTILFHPYLRDKTLPDYSLKHASNQMVNQLHKYGDVRTIDQIHRDLKSVFDDLEFDLLRVRSLIDIDKRLALMEDNGVALVEWRHVHPRTLRDKILFVLRSDKRPMHFSELSERISGANFDSRPVNLQAVHNELIRHDQFVLIGRGIYALNEWGYESGTVCEVIEKLLKDHGTLDQDEVVNFVLKKRQVKKITIVLALKNNKKFVRVGRKKYQLKGK